MKRKYLITIEVNFGGGWEINYLEKSFKNMRKALKYVNKQFKPYFHEVTNIVLVERKGDQENAD